MYKKFDFSSNNAWIPQKKEWECTYKDPNSTHVSCRHIDMGENITSLVEVITKSQKQHIHGAVWIISRVSQSEKWRCCVVWWYSSRYFCICCQMAAGWTDCVLSFSIFGFCDIYIYQYHCHVMNTGMFWVVLITSHKAFLSWAVMNQTVCDVFSQNARMNLQYH